MRTLGRGLPSEKQAGAGDGSEEDEVGDMKARLRVKDGRRAVKATATANDATRTWNNFNFEHMAESHKLLRHIYIWVRSCGGAYYFVLVQGHPIQ